MQTIVRLSDSHLRLDLERKARELIRNPWAFNANALQSRAWVAAPFGGRTYVKESIIDGLLRYLDEEGEKTIYGIQLSAANALGPVDILALPGDRSGVVEYNNEYGFSNSLLLRRGGAFALLCTTADYSVMASSLATILRIAGISAREAVFLFSESMRKNVREGDDEYELFAQTIGDCRATL